MTVPALSVPDLGDVSLLIRTDFADPPAWQRFLEAVDTPSPDGFLPYLLVLDDPAHDGLGAEEIVARLPGTFTESYLFVADRTTLASTELPVLVVPVPVATDDEDLADYFADREEFRVVTSELWGVQNNFSIANMDWADFADEVDPDGVFRDFRPR